MTIPVRVLLSWVWIATGGGGVLAAQVSVTGNLTAYGELYERSGTGPANRPDETGRVTANVTLNLFGGVLVAPFTAIVATDQVKFRQSINQLGISPRYKALTLHLGHFSPVYSAFTLADATLLGGGFGLAPGRFRVGTVYGRSRRVTDGTQTGAIPGFSARQWERRIAGGRIGFGNEERSYLDLFLTRGEDRQGGLDSSQNVLPPLEASTVIGYKGQISLFGDAIQLESEGARSRYTREDQALAEEVTANAVSARLLYNARTWSLGGTAELVEPGFVTLGNSGLADDHFDYGVTGSIQSGGGRFTLRGMAGWRENNLDDQLASTTDQTIYNISGAWQPGTGFGVDWQFANNVNDSRADDDTSSIKTVTGLYSLTPRFLFRTGGVQHVLVLVGSYQESKNTTPGSLQLLDTRSTTAVANYSATFPSSLGFVTTATWTRVDLDSLGESTIATIAPGMTFSFFRRRLQATAQVQLMRAEQPGGGVEQEWFPLLQLRWAIRRGHNLMLKTTYRHHEFATSGEFDERVVTLQYSASFR